MLPSGPLQESAGAYFTGDIPGIPAGGDGWNEGGSEKEGGGKGLWSRGQLGHPSPLALILSSLS